MRQRVEEVESLNPGPHWKEETPQGLAAVFWALSTMKRVESPIADTSTASTAVRPVSIAKPQRKLERPEGGDTGVRPRKEDLIVSIQMEESGNTDDIGMRVRGGKKEGCDTVTGGECKTNSSLEVLFSVHKRLIVYSFTKF